MHLLHPLFGFIVDENNEKIKLINKFIVFDKMSRQKDKTGLQKQQICFQKENPWLTLNLNGTIHHLLYNALKMSK